MRHLTNILEGLSLHLTKVSDKLPNYGQGTPLNLVTIKVDPSDFEYKLLTDLQSVSMSLIKVGPDLYEKPDAITLKLEDGYHDRSPMWQTKHLL